jgi:GxxExxY protein
MEYKGAPLDAELRLDVLVEDLILVELKAIDGLLPVHEAQVLTYMR